MNLVPPIIFQISEIHSSISLLQPPLVPNPVLLNLTTAETDRAKRQLIHNRQRTP